MNETLRVLQIEDSESDAALIVRLLRKAGFQVEWERVEDAAGTREALANRAWDVIIADYHLPQFDAPAALRIVQESGHDIPFLVVSAAIGEDAAVALMRAGAHDYLLKDHLARLAPAVERELREARMRRQRRQAEERLGLAILATQLGTFDYYPQTGELIWSDIARRQAGLSPEAPASHAAFLAGVHSDDRERVARAIADALRPVSGGQYAAEYRTVGAEDGIVRSLSAFGRTFFDPQGRPVRFVGVTLDVTEHKRLEDQFRQAQKLESIGRLAGGVAHDFNNLLTVISGYAHMVRNDLAERHPFQEPMQEIIKASDRATELTRRLLTFSRRQATEPKNLHLNDLVREVEKMLRRLIGEDIELAITLDPEAGSLRADPVQIEQVIMNLVVNAKDAMPQGGRLSIETDRFLVDEAFAHAHLAVRPGAYVALAVSDTGTGMSAETKAHIFEPFFTTKEAGKGTGLGLSTVYGIVKQSEGSIWVYSEPGQGSTFRILFPEVSSERAPAAADFSPAAVTGTETILLAEDEPGLRDLVRRVLSRQGYTLLEASNGLEALALARRYPDRIDLLLTDVVMPVMGGPELAGKFTAERPGIPVVFMSGYADRLGLQGGAPAGYLQKPFTAATLLTRLRAELARRESI